MVLDAIARRIASERLPPAYAGTVERFWRPLAARIAAAATGKTAFVVGINGAQGSGKSTLCGFLEGILAVDFGLRAVTLSLDDVYRTHAERLALARDVHPLLVTRGVPGTHDIDLARRTLAALGRVGTVAVPRFDKQRDDRVPQQQWPLVVAPVDIVLFEGWCVGASPQPASALATPVNRLEAEEDADCRWRTHVNAALAGEYAALFDTIDLLVMLRAPGFENVRGWRGLQEQKAGGAMGAAALDRFIAHYERLTRHMLETIPAKADIVVSIDQNHMARTIRYKNENGRRS